MIVTSESTAGEKPRCLECGVYAWYMELHGRWSPRCNCGSHNLRTKTGLERDLANAQATMNTVNAEILKFMALP